MYHQVQKFYVLLTKRIDVYCMDIRTGIVFLSKIKWLDFITEMQFVSVPNEYI